MNEAMNPITKSAIADLLTEVVRDTRQRRTVSLRAAVFSAGGLLVFGALAGGASATAMSGLAPSTVVPDAPGAPAPGSPLGGPSVDVIGLGGTFESDGSREVVVGPAPQGATHLSVSFTCFKPGAYEVSLGGESPVSYMCDRPVTSVADLPVNGNQSLVISSGDEGSYSVAYRWVTKTDAPWGTNPSGQTFGQVREDGTEPDLIAVIGNDSEGDPVYGYVLQKELSAGVLPTAAESEKQLTLFADDGITRLGTFSID